jgi:hypothetical protein
MVLVLVLVLVLYDILLIAVRTVLKKDTYSGKDQEEKEQIRNFCYYYYIHMNYPEKVSGRVLVLYYMF